MKIILSEKACFGCFACKQICPVNAIHINVDERGFNNPEIDKDVCVHCKMCQKVCPCNGEVTKDEFTMEVYGARHRDKAVLKQSQSGGIFSGIATKVLEKGGICYGAAVEEDCGVRQIRIQSTCDLYKLQGSKYIQSDVESTFVAVQKDLASGKTVLYSGTSCMISGLLNYLECKKVERTNLLTCDLICYGVPSPLFYNKNLEKIKKDHQAEVKKVKFRDKSFGWRGIMETYHLSNGKVINQKYYSEFFALKVLLRDCCYACEYTDVHNKKADISVGDFWGLKDYAAPFEDDNTGCSVVFIHSAKGKALFEEASFEAFELDFQTALLNNRNSPEKKPFYFEHFWKDYKKYGYEYCLKKYTSYGGKLAKVRRRIFRQLNKWSK